MTEYECAYHLCRYAEVPAVFEEQLFPTESEVTRIFLAWELFDKFEALYHSAGLRITKKRQKEWALASLKKHGFIW